jgi:hypothetical protein
MEVKMRKLFFISLMLFSGSLFAGPGYYWDADAWGECSVICGTGTQTRTIVCKDSGGNVIDDSNCDYLTKPDESQACIADPCTYTWETGSWGDCSEDCGGGIRARTVSCKEVETVTIVDDSNCEAGSKPAVSEACNIDPCVVDEDVVDEDFVEEDVVDEDFVEEDLVDEDMVDDELVDGNDEMPLIDANETPDEVVDENQTPDKTQTPDETETPDESQSNDTSVTTDDEPTADEVTDDTDTAEEKDKSNGCSCLII